MDTTSKTTNKIRNFITGLIAVALIGGALAPAANAATTNNEVTQAAAQRFTDVPPTRGDFEAINWMAENAITTGIGGGTTFAPDRRVTRAEFAAFLWRYMGRPDAPTSCGFRDVRSNSWAAKPTCWMKNQGLTNGINAEGTRYGPDQPIVRAQAVTMIWRLVGQPISNIPHNFTDVPPLSYYNMAVRWLKEHGLTTGKTATTFGSQDNLTRGQAALFLYRYDGANVRIAAPGTSSVKAVVGAWIFEKSAPNYQYSYIWEKVSGFRNRKSVHPTAFGGTMAVKVSEPANKPVDAFSVTLPSYIQNVMEGAVTATTTDECAGVPVPSWSGNTVTFTQFFCSDRDGDGFINGTFVLYLTNFGHNITTPGIRGGFEIVYGYEDNLTRRPTGGVVANFSENSPYQRWRGANDIDPTFFEPFPVQTRVTTLTRLSLPFPIGESVTTLTVNAPADAPIKGVRIDAKNETKEHLDISFDNDDVYNTLEYLQGIFGNHEFPHSRNPSSQLHLNHFKTAAWGECSSDPVAYPWPYTASDRGELSTSPYGVGDTLFVENLNCFDQNGDGFINGHIQILYHFVSKGLRSTLRYPSNELCQDTTKVSIMFGCVDESDIAISYGEESFGVELLTNGVYAPAPFHDGEFVHSYSQDPFEVAQVCTSKGPTWCYPNKDYPGERDPNSLIEYGGTWRTCLLYPYLCWPEGDWPQEYAEKIGRTCNAHPDRCQGAESSTPTMVLPWYGIRPISATSTTSVTDNLFTVASFENGLE